MAKGYKKYSKTVKDPKTGRKKTVRYGAKGYSIAPGTSKGDSYCARSYGQMKKHPKAAKNPNSPLRLSRAKWKCSGKKSRRSWKKPSAVWEGQEYSWGWLYCLYANIFYIKFKKNFGNNLTKNSLAKNINKDTKPPRNREFGRALVGSLVV